ALNTATVTLPALANANALAGNKAIVIDTTAPTVQSVSGPSGTYNQDALIPISVKFSEPVTVNTTSGTPTFSLKLTAPNGCEASACTWADYTGGSGTDTLTFTYKVALGQVSADLEYLSTGALVLNGGTIKDAAENGAILSLPGLGTAYSLAGSSAIDVNGDRLRIDKKAPSVTGVSSTVNGSYTVGASLPIQVTFDEPVVVSGSPTLTIVTNTQTQATRAVPYASGSGTDTLIFNYVVEAGDNSGDLEYVSADALSRSLVDTLGTAKITDLAGNRDRDTTSGPEVLTLPAPGTPGSLGANKNIVIDTVKPTFAVTYSNARSPSPQPPPRRFQRCQQSPSTSRAPPTSWQ
ncbi:MAG: hypothetical protein EBS94_17290, partial [Proteobacteria bacterium]|nr:hypothetical protein [Pseudomonadota bacterium]